MTYETLLVERRERVAIVRLNRPPANALDMRVCTELIAVLDELEGDEAIEGMVLSGRTGMFSAGLDVIALFKLNREMMRLFWRRFCQTFIRLYTSPLVTAAAINGHSPAGGCVLALGCDLRIMADGEFKIGLNEVAVGLPVPPFLCRVHAATVGQRNSESMLPYGVMSTPAEALMCGLVDGVLEPNQVLPHAIQHVEKRLKLPQAARSETKSNLRRQVLDPTEASVENEVDLLTTGWFSEECQGVMGALVKRLTRL